MRRSLETALAISLLFVACKSKDTPQAQPSAAPSASVTLNAFSRSRDAGSARRYIPKPAASRIPLPSGPRMAILAGKGVGPIRIGATRATIERQMARPCDVVTESLCRYIGRAVDFHLTGGVVDKVVVHRRDRPAGKDKSGRPEVFGLFNGGLPPDFEVMMKQQVIAEHLGPASRQEKVTEDNPNHTVERHYYDGMTLEYDRYDNGQIVLGAVIIEKSKGAQASPKGAPSAKP
jgi:hypothetical protein